MNCPICLLPAVHDDHDRCETFARTLEEALDWAIDLLSEMPYVSTPSWLESADALLKEITT
jgi:hypothetical protein